MRLANTTEMRKECYRIALLIGLSTLIVLFGSSATGKIKTIAVLPFKLNAAQDLGFLREGIMDMLSTRLTRKGTVAVLEKLEVEEKIAEIRGPLNREKGLLVAKALQADYVVIGSLTVFGERVSIDARVLDVAKSGELVGVFSQSKGIDDVLPAVNELAQDIASKISAPGVVPPRPVQAPKVKAAKEQVAEPVHKEVTPIEPFLTTKVPLEIVGLDVGDVDGDGRNELVMIDHGNIFLYRLRQKGLVRFEKISGHRSDDYVSVDVADLNGNGKAEIYVSNIIGDSLGSLVLELEKGDYGTLVKGENWFFRILNHPTEGESLVGQRREPGGSFTGGIYSLTLADEEIIKGKRLSLFPKANVFNFTMGDMEGSGRIDTAVLAQNGDLLLIGPDGEVDFEDEGSYGGSPTYIQDRSKDDSYPPVGEVVFLSSRLFMYDLGSDGKQELVLCRNELKTGRFFDRVRLFKTGRVLFLGKTGDSFQIKRQTGKLAKCVKDYQVKDVDNDGQPELIVAVTDPSKFAGKKWSRVMVCDLN